MQGLGCGYGSDFLMYRVEEVKILWIECVWVIIKDGKYIRRWQELGGEVYELGVYGFIKVEQWFR